MDYSHIRKKTQISHIFDPLYKFPHILTDCTAYIRLASKWHAWHPNFPPKSCPGTGTDTRDSERQEDSAAGSVWSRPEVIFAKGADRARA